MTLHQLLNLAEERLWQFCQYLSALLQKLFDHPLQWAWDEATVPELIMVICAFFWLLGTAINAFENRGDQDA